MAINLLDNMFENTYIAFDKYYVRLKKDNKFVFAYIEFFTRDEFVKYDKDKYDLIVIEDISNKKQFTLLECEKYGTEATENKIIIKYRVDRILDDVLTDINDEFIKEADITFDDINWFVNDDNSFDFDPEKVCVSVKDYNLEYVTNIGKIAIFKSFSFMEKSNIFNIESDMVFRFVFEKKISYHEFRKRIYCFRNLLLILGRRNIELKSIKINEKYLFDCYEEYKYRSINERYMEYLDHHTITIGSIDEFGESISKFYDIYDTILSIIDSYFCSVKYTLPTKVKFINACTMIEDYANIFLVDESKKHREKEATNNKQKYIAKVLDKMLQENVIDEAKKDIVNNILDTEVKKDMSLSFKDKVISIIQNVNKSFDFDDAEIELIADNFREARKQFVHKGIIPKEEVCPILEMYCSFVEDIIYLNILSKIGIDISSSIFRCIEYEYNKDDLIIAFQ